MSLKGNELVNCAPDGPTKTDTSLLRKAIFMQLFLLEVRKRTDTPSIIWLHDGLWIGRDVL